MCHTHLPILNDVGLYVSYSLTYTQWRRAVHVYSSTYTQWCRAVHAILVCLFAVQRFSSDFQRYFLQQRSFYKPENTSLPPAYRPSTKAFILARISFECESLWLWLPSTGEEWWHGGCLRNESGLCKSSESKIVCANILCLLWCYEVWSALIKWRQLIIYTLTRTSLPKSSAKVVQERSTI